jgi:hypothetical protein
MGKPKLHESSEDEEDQSRIQEIFRQHFEEKFNPLPASKSLDTPFHEEIKSQEEGNEEDHWSGFSSEEENVLIEVDHANSSLPTINGDGKEWKAFMVSIDIYFMFLLLIKAISHQNRLQEWMMNL